MGIDAWVWKLGPDGDALGYIPSTNQALDWEMGVGIEHTVHKAKVSTDSISWIPAHRGITYTYTYLYPYPYTYSYPYPYSSFGLEYLALPPP